MTQTHHDTDPLSAIAECVQHLTEDLTRRLRTIENKEVSEASRGHRTTLFASLPAASATNAGWVLFVSNGRKVGEGAGAGTGVMAYSDGTNWYRFSDDTVVAA